MTIEQKASILIVEDEQAIRSALVDFLEFHGFKVSQAVDGLEAERAVAERQFDLILLDYKMPGMNGLEFISQAKESYPDKKYYILTGYHITEEIQNAIDTGLILGYLKKPFNKPEIQNAIEA